MRFRVQNLVVLVRSLVGDVLRHSSWLSLRLCCCSAGLRVRRVISLLSSLCEKEKKKERKLLICILILKAESVRVEGIDKEKLFTVLPYTCRAPHRFEIRLHFGVGMFSA